MYLDTTSSYTQQENLLEIGLAEFIVTDSLDLNFFMRRNWQCIATVTLFRNSISVLKREILSDSLSMMTCSKKMKLAYVCHTSGSTGKPKAVRVPHSCIVPNIDDLR